MRNRTVLGSPAIEWNCKSQANREEILGGVEIARPERRTFISGAPQRFFAIVFLWNFLTFFFGRLHIRKALLFSLICHNALSRRLSRSTLLWAYASGGMAKRRRIEVSISDRTWSNSPGSEARMMFASGSRRRRRSSAELATAARALQQAHPETPHRFYGATDYYLTATV
jgi:hypothetical protein